MSSKFAVSHPSTCEDAINVKNEKCDYIILVEYLNVYVSSNASVKDGYRAF